MQKRAKSSAGTFRCQGRGGQPFQLGMVLLSVSTWRDTQVLGSKWGNWFDLGPLIQQRGGGGTGAWMMPLLLAPYWHRVSPSPDPRPYKVVAAMAEAAKPAPSNACPQAPSLPIIPLSNQLFRVTGWIILKGTALGVLVSGETRR